jgi:uncharacterized membrane protein YbhN (UPF0104 family)
MTPASQPVQIRSVRMFVDTEQPRARRATDVLVLAGSLVGLVAASGVAFPPPGFVRVVVVFLGSWPGFFRTFWQILADLLLLFALVVLVGAVAVRLRSVGRDLVLGLILAVAASLVASRLVVGSWVDLWESLRHAEPPPWYPATRVALPGSVIFTASPHLTLPFRRAGRWALFLGAFSTVVLGGATPLGAIAGFLVAASAAAVVHLALGSTAGRPSVSRVAAALAERGILTGSLGAVSRQQAGVFVLQGDDGGGGALIVKVYGRDSRDTALLSTLWRAVWYRQGASFRLGRLEQVEHEGLLTLLAGQAGILTDTVVAAGGTADRDAVLVLRRCGSTLAQLAPAGRDSRWAEQVWSASNRLLRAGIAHGQLDEDHLIELNGDVGVVDFRGATATPSELQRRADQAQALVTTSLLVGRTEAVRSAQGCLGSEGLAALLPLLQLPVLTPSQRRRVRETGLDLDALRTESADMAGADPPELQRIQRVTWRSVIRVLLPVIAILALLSAAGDIDWSKLADQLANATWWLVVFGFFAAQFPRVSQAVSTLGASPKPLPLGPVYALQLALSYINLAIPGSAGRIAISIRFFQRQGVPAGTALSLGALDGISGLVVQALILGGLLLFTSASLELDLSAATPSAVTWIFVAAVLVAVASIVLVLAVGRWRRFVTGWVRRLAGEARQTLSGLHSPRRLALLLGGNVATEVLFASALGVFVRAFGYPIGLADLLFINISVALLAGLVPIPGGIGVAEGALVFGLVRAGVPEEAAFAATIMFRLSNFYLPPIWGYFAMRWLERTNNL